MYNINTEIDLTAYAKKSLNYLTRMTDPAGGYLPYWLVTLSAKPAYGTHCRVDDAELSGSWSKAITLMRKMLNTTDGAEAEAGINSHLFKTLDPETGLSFGQNFPWTKVDFAGMHEQAWMLDGLVYLLKVRNDEKTAALIAKMVRGLDSIAVHKRERVFWHGNHPQQYNSCYLPFDNYFRGSGWDPARWRGSSEVETRNGDLILGLAEYWEETKDDAAYKLAEGMVNHLVFDSRKFGYNSIYIGHVHATMWAVNGVLKWGILNDREDLIVWAKNAWGMTRLYSSSFGWVPEYINRNHPAEEVCETCCIADMIWGAIQLAENGFPEYWEEVDRFTRNHLIVSQLDHLGTTLTIDNSLFDTELQTWRDIDQRMCGAFPAGTHPNHIQLTHFRASAGCCGATGANTLFFVWDAIDRIAGQIYSVRLPMNKSTEISDIIFRNGTLSVMLKRPFSKIRIRVPEYSREFVTVSAGEQHIPFCWFDKHTIEFDADAVGISYRIQFNEPLVEKEETVACVNYTVRWQGNTVLNMIPATSRANSEDQPLYNRKEIVNYEPSRL